MGNTNLASAPEINLTKVIIVASLHATALLYNPSEASELTCKVAY